MEESDKTKEFIHKASLIHGDKYDYSKVDYVNCHTKCIITCKIHGDFLQRPNGHLAGKGCKKCATKFISDKRKSNSDEFVEKSKEIHGDKYDYSKVEYVNSNTKVTIICKIHGEFIQKPNNHLSGKGCSKCAGCYQYSTCEFIEKAKEIHGDKYDYSKVEYVKSNEKVIIICKKHGEFLQSPANHLQGNGCITCVDRGCAQRYDNDEFIKVAKETHCDKYDYSKVEYINSQTKVIIICKEHGEFNQLPSSHIRGAGCPVCSGVYKKNTIGFIEIAKEIHEDKYNYSKVEYVNSKEKIIIICKEHGEFNQTPDSHLQGCGCNNCASVIKKSIHLSNKEEFIEKAKEIHEDKYDYSNVEYIKSNEKVIIICKKHGEFNQTPGSHLQGVGCPLCKNKTEGKLYENIKQVYPSIIAQFKEEWCIKISYLPFDFCIPEHKIIIELDGPQHFRQVSNWSSPEEQFENDKYKEKCANDNGYSVIRILQEDVFYDTYDWLNDLCNAIEELKNGNKIDIKYLCKNGEYDAF
jgi:very-short-patch-repair endonuclease